MINRGHVRTLTAALIGVASLCFPACGPEVTDESPPPPVDPARNPQEKPTSWAMHDSLAQPLAPKATEHVWKVVDPAAPGGDRREPVCLPSSAAAALPSPATPANRFAAAVEPPVTCRAGTTGLVPVTPLPPAGDADHVEVVQRE